MTKKTKAIFVLYCPKCAKLLVSKSLNYKMCYVDQRKFLQVCNSKSLLKDLVTVNISGLPVILRCALGMSCSL